MNINISTKGSISFGKKSINFVHTYQLPIRRVLITEKLVYVLLYPENDDRRSDNYVEYDKNNLFAFDFEGDLKWRVGKLIRETYRKDGMFYEYAPVSLNLNDDLLLLDYGSIALKVWLDPITGKIVKQQEDKYRF